jgi:UDP-hydrolysing UDP-N-acetyl-D-glucosamine 2-epimerase
MKKRIAYITTSRSDYGPSYWLIHDLFADQRFEMTLVAGGAHLSRIHGNTISEIESHGWTNVVKVPFLPAQPSNEATGSAAARALAGFSKAFEQIQPDIVILYGDRYELLPIATAAVLLRIPIAHICGGDVTEGAFDEQVRHAVSKLAHLHFPSTELSASRLHQMGEEAWRIHWAGDPCLDHFSRGQHASTDELTELFGFVPEHNTLLVTFHPATLDWESVPEQARELALALKSYNGPIVITAPAPDPGADSIREEFLKLSQERHQTVYIDSLGSYRYRGLLSLVGAVVGNSSSGLIEAASVPVPVVNIGKRQGGRERAQNVIDVEPSCADITSGITQALSPQFRQSLVNLQNPYGDGHSSSRIITELANMPDRNQLLTKRFALFGK